MNTNSRFRLCHQRTLLLVVLLLCYAHAPSAVTSPITATNTLLAALGDAVKVLRAAQQNLEDAQRPASASVVQDWSLVCKELCGAGPGAAPCAAYCEARLGLPILSPEYRLAICENLLELQSDGVDNCVKPDSKIIISRESGDRLCASYCQQRRATFSGCSPCQLSSVNEASVEQSVATHGSIYAAPAPVPIAADIQYGDAATTATPDWNELCKELCKTGDGGSLCNCDLSPFLA